MLQYPSWDMIVTIFLVTGVAYGFILQREKILATLVSVYIAMAVANAWGLAVHEFFTGDRVIFGQLWLRSTATLFHVRIIIFIIFVVLLSLKGEFADMTKRQTGLANPLIVFGYSFLNAVLIIATVISFLVPSAQTELVAESKLAAFIIKYHIAWIVLPAIMMIIIGLRKGPAPNAESK